MGTEAIIGALVAAVVSAAGLLLILQQRKRPRDFGLGAVDTARFDAVISRLVAQQSGFDPWHVSAPSHPQPARAPVHRNLSDIDYGRRLVSGIAQMHDITLFACLSQPDAAAQVDILSDLLTTAALSPYIVDADKDPAIVLGLPLADDHAVPLVMYINGEVIGDFVAVTDALRAGSLSRRLVDAQIVHDAAAIAALQDSLHKA